MIYHHERFSRIRMKPLVKPTVCSLSLADDQGAMLAQRSVSCLTAAVASMAMRALPLLVLFMAGVRASAQSESHASATDTAPTSDIVITGERDHDIAPLMRISPRELNSYGADSVQELLDALQPRIQSSMSNDPPVVLINGRLAGPTELQNLPREAILRVDVLPEKAALRYGFPDDRRVVNFVLREHFRGILGAVVDNQTTEGGAQIDEVYGQLARIDHDTQTTVKAYYRHSAQLLESQRDITAADSHLRTLEPDTSEAVLAATATRPLFGLQPSIEASVDIKSSDSLQGLATAPEGSADIVLRQHTGTTTTHFAARINGLIGELTWTTAATYDGTIAHTLGGTGLDATGALLLNRTDASANTGGVEASLGGRAAKLPAGGLAININVAAQRQDSRAQTELSGSPTTVSHLSRTVGRARLNANIPLTSRDEDILPSLGDLAARLRAGAQEVSSFGILTSFGGGLTWQPARHLSFNADFSDIQAAPNVQALLAPDVFTPGVQLFDFVTDETVYVTQITGGNADLRASDSRVTTLGLSVGPFENGDGFTAYYSRSRVSDAAGTIPPVTSAVEAAFPDRFVRDPLGTLAQVDDRSVNLALQEKDQLVWGFYLQVPAPKPAATGSNAEPNLQFRASLYDTWYFRDTLLVRSAIPELDLLNGAPLSVTGSNIASTQPRHAIDLHTDLVYGAFTVQLRTRWNSATDVNGGTPSAPQSLHFSAMGTVDLRTFADLERTPGFRGHPWTKGVRVTVVVSNLLNSHQQVRDAMGITPTGFEPGYVDPYGRVVTLSLRKLL
jgi:hypothetical protein